jgi:hypothetical protein
MMVIGYHLATIGKLVASFLREELLATLDVTSGSTFMLRYDPRAHHAFLKLCLQALSSCPWDRDLREYY